MKKLFGLLIIVMAGTLVNCSIFSPVPSSSQTQYLLDKVPPVSTQQSSRAITILVTQPEADTAYQTNQMAYSVQPHQIAYFAKHRWVNQPREMILPLIVQSLQTTHYFHAVITPSVAGRYDYILNTQLEELVQDYTQGPMHISLIMRAEIIRTTNYKVVATKRFTITKPLLQNSPYAGVLAANQATAEMLRQLTQFCVKNIK